MLPHPHNPTFPTRLKQERQARGWSLSELARRAGINPVMVGRYEAAKVRPTPRTWNALNRALASEMTPAIGGQPESELASRMSALLHQVLSVPGATVTVTLTVSLPAAAAPAV